MYKYRINWILQDGNVCGYNDIDSNDMGSAITNVIASLTTQYPNKRIVLLAGTELKSVSGT